LTHGFSASRDANHMTGTYAATLGPYVLRALDRLTGSRRRA
jgi:hypothetical protein